MSEIINPCTGPTWSCGESETKEQVTGGSRTTTARNDNNTVFLLSFGGVSIKINNRFRSYSYVQNDAFTNSGGKVVVIPDGLGAAYIDCITRSETHNATISESYTTIDVTFKYVDLRYDIAVYTEDIGELTFQKTESQRVALDTPYDDAYAYPFIDENLPIKRTKKIICTEITEPLFEEVVNAGYWNGLRLLMPDWHGTVPRHTPITIDGVSYDAYDVDWYDQYLDWEPSGNRFLWWPEWLRVVPTNVAIDQQSTKRVYESDGHGLLTPFTETADSGVVQTDFMGSAAKDKDGNLFLSAELNASGQVVLVSKLIVGGIDTPLPTEEIKDRVGDPQETNTDGSLKWTDLKESESDVWFPIAPL